MGSPVSLFKFLGFFLSDCAVGDRFVNGSLEGILHPFHQGFTVQIEFFDQLRDGGVGELVHAHTQGFGQYGLRVEIGAKRGHGLDSLVLLFRDDPLVERLLQCLGASRFAGGPEFLHGDVQFLGEQLVVIADRTGSEPTVATGPVRPVDATLSTYNPNRPSDQQERGCTNDQPTCPRFLKHQKPPCCYLLWDCLSQKPSRLTSIGIPKSC